MSREMTDRRRSPVLIILLVIVLALIVLAVAAYLLLATYFKTHFYPNTTVNGTDYSLKTAEYVEKQNAATADDYLISIYDRDGNLYYISGEDFDYSYEETGEEQELIDEQESYMWPLEFTQAHDYTVSMNYVYDEDKLLRAIEKLDLFDEENYVAPTDASLEVDEDGNYTIIEETYGSTLIEEAAEQTILDAVAVGETMCTLEDDCYVQPEVLSTDAALMATLANIDAVYKAEITYEIEGEEFALTTDKIKDMVSVDADGNVSFVEDAITSFVQTMASTFNTYGRKRDFTTSLGDVIQIGGGDYGWVIDKTAEAAQIMEDLANGEPVTREPMYEQTAIGPVASDIGNTYIEIDYTNQHLYYYLDGELQLDSDVVTGKISNGNGSPDGVFKIVYKERNATLVGEGYSSPVDYFMPFAYNVGIHDASWRSKFGGTIYKSSGSHGCVNAPYDIAQTLFNTVEVGTPVIAYYRESVKLTSESNRISNAYSYVSSN